MENQRVVLSKKMLKDAFLKLLGKKDLMDISVKELCEVSGINRSTFYRHYNNISEIQDEITNDILNLLMKTNDSSLKDPDNALDYIMDAVRFFREHSEFDPLMKTENFALNQLFRKVEEQIMKNPKYRYTKQNRYLVRYLLYGSYGIIRDWIASGRQEDVKEFSDTIYTLCCNTVRFQ